MNKKKHRLVFGAFCEIYGKTIRNLVLEFLLENKGLDFAVGDMARELKISKPKAYQEIKKFKKKGHVVKSRVVAGTQLYILNEKKSEVKQLLKSFKECLLHVIEEQQEPKRAYTGGSGLGVAAATKNV